ncbi:hypothetical protein BDQ12DRAFT_680560 [Crucibulum laeve]|uniref:Uncharacterized protein n=1 Tax=Crucibulum laeve TaxID=68775 RepID=A0A5C3M754_9AGAR|nr:hypothetical protein BDQ12DRAFT_680560 [Crucibulum laeve]
MAIEATKLQHLLTSMEKLAVEHQGRIQALTEPAIKAFAIMESWSAAKSNHEEGTYLIELVNKQGQKLYHTLERSAQVSKRGHRISQDMGNTIEYIMDDTISSEEIVLYVEQMQQLTAEAENEAKKTCSDFNSVRRGILKITNRIPGNATILQEDYQQLIKKNEESKRNGDRAKVIKVCSTALTAVAGGITLIACPPAVILLPIVLPLITLIAEGFDMHNSKKIEKRKTEARDIEDALQVVNRAATELATLTETIDIFAHHWTKVETLLNTIRGRMDELREGKGMRLRLKALKSSWDEVGQSYLTYAVTIQRLQAFVPPPNSSITSDSDRTSRDHSSSRSSSKTSSRSGSPHRSVKSSGFLTVKGPNTRK